jgi:dsRNA-specific ribonuclease
MTLTGVIGDWKTIQKDLLSKQALAGRGKRLGLPGAMQLVLRDRLDDVDKLLATAIWALVGAVYVDAGDEAVDRVLSTLGLYSHALLGHNDCW